MSKGDFTLHATSDTVIAYVRGYGNGSVFCAFNLGSEPEAVDLPAGDWSPLDTGFAGAIVGSKVQLPPYQAFFAERA